jgi:hypothetical protein
MQFYHRIILYIGLPQPQIANLKSVIKILSTTTKKMCKTNLLKRLFLLGKAPKNRYFRQPITGVKILWKITKN